MQNKFIYFCWLSTIFSQLNSFNLITSISDGANLASLNNLVLSLEQNVNNFLISKIHIFYKNPPKKLPAIFQNSKVKIIATSATPYFEALTSYANNSLNGQRVIIARPNTYFDDTLFKLNYYPLSHEFICLNNTSNYSCWIFQAPTTVSIPKQIKFTDPNIDLIVASEAVTIPGLKVLNPPSEVISYQSDNKKNPNPSNLATNNLSEFELDWELVRNGAKILLYAGNMHCNNPNYCTPAINPNCYKFACLSPNKSNNTHLIFDVTKKLPLPDNCVDVYLSEDNFEHLEYSVLVGVINEIYRVLKPGGLFRLAMPDYRCDLLENRSIKDINGNIIFDPQGGGQFVNGKVIDGGHLWFPIFETTQSLLKQTKFFTFGKINFLHYYDPSGKSIANPIDYSVCYVRRTPDHDRRVQKPARVMSIVVDLNKKSLGASVLTALWPFKQDTHEQV